MNWKLKKIKVSDLKENPRNPRNLTEKGLKDLESSIKKFGLAEPLVVNTDLMICGGHGRKKILEKLNIESVDCYLPEKKLTPKQFDELGIRLNKNIAGEFNFDILANEFEVDELIEWGFEEFEIEVSDTKIVKENLNPYKKTHILISFDPIKLMDIENYLEKIKNVEGIEYEQSSN